VGYDPITEARAESIRAYMAGGDPTDPRLFLDDLEKNPWEAASVTWTLHLDGSPIYAILPGGPFAAEAYQRLRTFLAEHAANETERVSIPGKVSGRTTLLNGHVLDVVVPELRGMASWTTKALVDAVVGQPQAAKPAAQASHTAKVEGVGNFLQRVYYEFRNLGATAEERAINFAATNASKVAGVFHMAAAEGMELDNVSVERSPICRPGSECWDVKMMFFYPDRPVQSVRKSYRLTVDVSDVVPVLVGPIRSWSVR
jgi:cyanobactin maturation PatA/PatG family protease